MARPKRPKKPASPKKGARASGGSLVESLLESLQGDKSFRGWVMTLSADDVLCHVSEFISTQVMGVNRALGTPGIPVGRITEIMGEEGVGKSTLSDHILAETQRMGGVAVLLDTEEARSIAYTERIGVDVSKLIVMQARTIEDSFSMMESLINRVKASGEDPLVTIVVDSIGGTPSRAELERPSGAPAANAKSAPPADAAKIIKYELRRLVQMIAGTRLAVVFVNHLYTVINPGRGERGKRAYGGSGVPFFATQRIEVKGGAKFWAAGLSNDAWKTHKPLGQFCSVSIWKNKVAVPHGYGRFALIYGVGCDNIVTIYDDLVSAGKVASGGSWKTLGLPDGEELKWQGDWRRLREMMIEDPELYSKVCAVHSSIWSAIPDEGSGE